MKIEKDHLFKIAHLARLEVDERDEQNLVNEMSAICDWVDKLNEVHTDGVEPLTTMSHEINTLRDDRVEAHLTREQALANAPKKDENYFRVPKVIE